MQSKLLQRTSSLSQERPSHKPALVVYKQAHFLFVSPLLFLNLNETCLSYCRWLYQQGLPENCKSCALHYLAQNKTVAVKKQLRFTDKSWKKKIRNHAPALKPYNFSLTTEVTGSRITRSTCSQAVTHVILWKKKRSFTMVSLFQGKQSDIVLNMQAPP